MFIKILDTYRMKIKILSFGTWCAWNIKTKFTTLLSHPWEYGLPFPAARAALPTLSDVCSLLFSPSWWCKAILWIVSGQQGISPTLLRFPTTKGSLTCTADGTRVQQLIVFLRWTIAWYFRQTRKRNTAPSRGVNPNTVWIWSSNVVAQAHSTSLNLKMCNWTLASVVPHLCFTPSASPSHCVFFHRTPCFLTIQNPMLKYVISLQGELRLLWDVFSFCVCVCLLEASVPPQLPKPLNMESVLLFQQPWQQ